MGNGNEGISKLTKVLQSRIHTVGDKPQVLDFGLIQDDMSLLTNKFPLPIPKSDYMICRSVSWNPAVPMTMTWWDNEAASVDGWEDEDWDKSGWQGGKGNLHTSHGHGKKGEHDHTSCPTGKHYHDVYLPNKMRWIKPGDRVLVAWVGDDACVIDLILQASEI